ncbi:peptide chain release factor H [Neptuniibacter caesariensis]|uniref:Peptide chain release factor 2 n=1 Tax=Neptuniibacter caesariensis TaxID=207954 RepID=A0A7U8C892_NEPCE|nr:peptide chain release factor H [Neptuniibacter caesariensis]EAR61910.1 peptide chain release factor 2 [Oceanospirillum sp. MED92] [Neptuniibacter caesariensis]
MILLQLSAGQGPDECAYAVGLALKQLDKDAKAQAVSIKLISGTPSEKRGGYKSLLLQCDADSPQRAKQFAETWQGVLLWICQSPFRPKHKRKNWFFSGQVYEIAEETNDGEITYQTCRASGAGGQHVNTTDSAVRATHVSSGISVRVESERSQHANKRLAKLLILQKLAEQVREEQSRLDKAHWLQHQELERGNPARVFKGLKFVAV